MENNLELYDLPSLKQLSFDHTTELRIYRYPNRLGALVYAPTTWGQTFVVQPVAFKGFDYQPKTLSGVARQEVKAKDDVERLLRTVCGLPAL